MQVSRFLVPATSGLPVAFVFNLPRAPVRLTDGASIEATQSGNLLIISGRPSTWTAKFEWDGPPPALVKVLELDDAGKPQRAFLPVGGNCFDDAHAYAVSTSAESLEIIDGYVAYHMAVQETIAAMVSNARKRYCSYFSEINLNTHFELLSRPIPGYVRPIICDPRDLFVALESMKGHLHGDIKKRASHYANSRTIPLRIPLPPVTGGGATRPLAIALSSLLRTIAERHFMSSTELEEAYEMFANGELRFQLRDQSWACQPTSGYYFFLGEFALLCMSESIDAQFWRPISRALIRTQRVYSRVYPVANPASALLESYGPCAFRIENQYSCSEKRSLTAQYLKCSDHYLPVLAAENLIECAGGEI